MVWRNPRSEIVPGIAALSEKGRLLRKSVSRLKANSPPGFEIASMLSRRRSTFIPNFTESTPFVRETYSEAWMEVQWKRKLEGLPSPPEKNVSPGTMTAAAFSPGTVPKEGSATCDFPLGNVKPVVVTTRLIPKRKEFRSCGPKVWVSFNVKNWRRESYPVRLLLSSSGCLTLPPSNIYVPETASDPENL